MNSCLYKVNVMHARTKPKGHKFTHKFFMFYLDVDELDKIDKHSFFFGRNRPAVYSFRDRDHMDFGAENVKENLEIYLRDQGIDKPLGRVMLLTYVRTWGYVFNPVSFYYCFDRKGEPLCCVAQIGNTFGEQKLYLLDGSTLKGNTFSSVKDKDYYISPFIDFDIPLDFRLEIPGERLKVRVDDVGKDGKFLYATMTGEKIQLNDTNLFKYTCLFPLVTLKVIGLIHWHAFVLAFVKRIPFHMKEEETHKQKEVLRVWRNTSQPYRKKTKEAEKAGA